MASISFSSVLSCTPLSSISVERKEGDSNEITSSTSSTSSSSSSTSVSSPPPSIISATILKVENVIASIIKTKAEGNKVGLFIGRTNAESVPEQTGWKWFSLDQMKTGTDNLDRHLEINFHSFVLQDHVQGLFNKVVVDLSVIKFLACSFFDRPLFKLHFLLAREESSELIVESWSGISAITRTSVPIFDPACFTMSNPGSDLNDLVKKKRINYEVWRKSVGEEQANKIKEDYVKNKFTSMRSIYESWSDEQIMTDVEGMFVNHILEKNDMMPEKINHVPELLKRIKEHAETFFNQVTLREDSQFPCREGDKASYWHMKSPK